MNKNKILLIALMLVTLIVFGMALFNNRDNSTSRPESPRNVSYVYGQSENAPQASATDEGDYQVVKILAKGGYSPLDTNAKAGKKTILRVETNNTFDCSSALSIPQIKVRENLPSSGVKEFEIEPQEAGTKITGTCSMGMYYFRINFI